jgi:hypothetical protein
MFTEPDLSRRYRHRDCGGITEISGDDYVRLECPFRGCSGTYCASCCKFVSLNAVEWEDSGERISDYRSRVYASVSPLERLRLTLFANAYEGALNLNLDRTGKPRPGPKTFDLDAHQAGIPPAVPGGSSTNMMVIAGFLMVVTGLAASGAAWQAQARWQRQDEMAQMIVMGGTFLWGAGGVVAVAGLLARKDERKSGGMIDGTSKDDWDV